MESVDLLASSPAFWELTLTWFMTSFVCSRKTLCDRLRFLLTSGLVRHTVDPVLGPCLIRHLDRFAEENNPACFESDRTLADAIFSLWVELDISDDANVLVPTQGALCRIFKSSPLLSHHLCLRVESLPPHKLISKSLGIEQIDRTVSRMSLSHLLVEADYIRYSEAVLKLIVLEEEDTRSSTTATALFSSKTLPAVLVSFEESNISSREKQKIVELLVKAATVKIQTGDFVPKYVCEALLSFDVNRLSTCSSEQMEGLVQVVSSSVTRSLDSSCCTSTLVDLALHIYQACTKIRLCPESAKMLGFNALSTLCSTIERLLRLSKKDSSCSSKCCEAVHSLCTLWNSSLCDKKEDIITIGNISTFLALLRSCVKHGLGTRTSNNLVEQSVRLSCLQMILCTVSDPSNHRLSALLGKPYREIVFQLITSHSNFSEILTQDSFMSLKVLVLRVLVLSFSSNSGSAPFDPNTWSSVLSAYNAGLSSSDVLARRFLFRYSKLEPPETHNCLMDQLRWGLDAGSNPGSDTWDWLPSWIELSRVNETLERFPFDDTFERSTAEDSDNWKPGAHQENEASPDVRYSPGFLLPLILAALEGRSPEEKQSDSGNVSHFNGDGKACTTSQALLLQKLCEKGALAIALGSLCCECADIRRVAIAILALANVLVRSDEAQRSSSWRERPQAVLILDCVRRALAKEIANSYHLTDGIAIPAEVPKILPPCAVFLAKASLILATPGDDLFPSLNRYFLRIDTEHGAVQDLRRLPAFVSLFCSGTMTDGVAFRERCWAVETLRDSFINESCFGPAMACHALELLVTRMEYLVSSALSPEFDAVVSALSRVVECGGPQGISYLIGRLGLLSWLRSLVTCRRILHNSTKILFDIFNLISLVLDKSDVLSVTELSAMTRGLPEAVLEATVEWSRTCRRSGMVLSLGSFRRLLHRLSRCYEKDDDGDHIYGITPRSATQVLLNEEDAYMQETLHALCTLPIHVDQEDPESATAFCTAILRALLSIDKLKVETCCKSIRCANRVINTFLRSETSLNAEVANTIKSVRHRCCRWKDSREAWHELFESLSSQAQT